MSPVDIHLPFAIKWVIKESDIKSLASGNSGAFHSKRKRLNPHIQYHLSLFPFGSKEENRQQTIIALNLELGRSHKVSADFSVVVGKFSESVTHFFNKTGIYESVICSSQELFDPEKKFFTDGEMIVNVKGVLKFSEEQIENFVQTNARNLGKALYERGDKDFAFVVKGQQIQIHKYILGVQSPVFDRMVQSGMKESKNNYVEIPNYPFEVVEIIVKLCYDVFVPEAQIYENKVQLFEFADQYQMDSIKEMIETMIIKKLSVINVCSLTNCAIIGKAENLQKHCYNLLMKCLKEETIVADLNILNKDFKLKLLEDAFVFVG
uniref:BTB domain-containing protein n=1 Tax=Panagrolaimus davidi TaxID=227884 RepID=A0A914QMW5_9BILA